MDPPFEALESQIEGMWRELLPNDLSLHPMPQVRCAFAVVLLFAVSCIRQHVCSGPRGLHRSWTTRYGLPLQGAGAARGMRRGEALRLGLQELKYCDSLDPEHKMPSSYMEAEWPQRGQPGYPRMQLENRCYESRVFRRLHMELVHRQDSIQVRPTRLLAESLPARRTPA